MQNKYKQNLIALFISCFMASSVSAQVTPVREFFQPSTSDSVIGVAEFSPDSKKLITGRAYARLWNVETGEMLLEFQGNENLVSAAAFSRDGKLAATGDWNGNAIVWKVDTGEVLYKFQINQPPFFEGSFQVRALAFSPDETTLVTGAMPGIVDPTNAPELRFWNLETGEKRKPFTPTKFFTVSLEYSANGKYLLLNHALLLDASSGEFLFRQTDEYFSFSSDRNRIIGFVQGKEWDIASKAVVREFTPPEIMLGEFTTLSPDGELILAKRDSFFRLQRFNADGVMENLRTFSPVNPDAFQFGKFSPNQKYVLTTSGNKAFLWDISDLTTGIPNAAVFDN